MYLPAFLQYSLLLKLYKLQHEIRDLMRGEEYSLLLKLYKLQPIAGKIFGL